MPSLTTAFVTIKALIIGYIGLSTAALNGWRFGPEVGLCVALLILAGFRTTTPARGSWVRAAVTAAELALAAGLYLNGAGSLANGVFTLIAWESAFAGGTFLQAAAVSSVSWVLLAALRVTVYGSQMETWLRSVNDLVTMGGGAAFWIMVHQLVNKVEQQHTDLTNANLALSEANRSLADANRRLVAHAQRDDVTGLLSYTGFCTEAELAVAASTCVALVVLDVKGFKDVNWAWGRYTGDAILTAVARRLKEASLPEYVLGRLMGAQFAVLIPACSLGAARDTATQLAQVVTDQPYVVAGTPHPVRLHLHHGVAAVPPAAGVQELLRHADDDLHAVKREDVVRRLEVRVREERLAALGEMAAGLAHELRNPLTTVHGFLQLYARRNQLDPNTMPVVLSEMNRVRTLVGDFLSFARPVQLQCREVSVEELLQPVIAFLRDRAGAGVQVTHSIQPSDATAFCDAGGIRQVLFNLADNALDAVTEQGTVRLVACVAETGVTFEMHDSGPGIEAPALQRLFEPFVTTKRHGTGLGLAISRNIVQAHGGRLEATSQPGAGTVFHVWLPARVSSRSQS